MVYKMAVCIQGRLYNLFRNICNGRQLCLFYQRTSSRMYSDDFTDNDEDPEEKEIVFVNKDKKSKLIGEPLFGINPVMSALIHRKRTIHKLLVKEGLSSPSSKPILRMAFEKGVKKKWVSEKTLNKMTGNRPHQGVVLDVDPIRAPFLNLQDVSKISEGKRRPVWLFLYKVKDPMNTGGILRTAYFLGVDRIVLPYRGSGGLTPVTSKASSGAMEIMKLSKCRNYGMTMDLIREWKENGGVVVGTASSGPYVEPINNFSTDKPVLLFSGNEADGVPPEILNECDKVLTIPSREGISPEIDSLNVSVATGIILHNIMKDRISYNRNYKQKSADLEITFLESTEHEDRRTEAQHPKSVDYLGKLIKESKDSSEVKRNIEGKKFDWTDFKIDKEKVIYGKDNREKHHDQHRSYGERHPDKQKSSLKDRGRREYDSSNGDRYSDQKKGFMMKDESRDNRNRTGESKECGWQKNALKNRDKWKSDGLDEVSFHEVYDSFIYVEKTSDDNFDEELGLEDDLPVRGPVENGDIPVNDDNKVYDNVYMNVNEEDELEGHSPFGRHKQNVTSALNDAAKFYNEMQMKDEENNIRTDRENNKENF